MKTTTTLNSTHANGSVQLNAAVPATTAVLPASAAAAPAAVAHAATDTGPYPARHPVLFNINQETNMIEFKTGSLTIEQVREKINVLNAQVRLNGKKIFKEGLSGKPIQKINYIYFDPKSKVWTVEMHGKRETQEDRAIFGLAQSFSDLLEDNRVVVLKETVRELQRQLVKNLIDHSGATLCANILCGNRVYTVNVGDSGAYAGIFDEKNQLVEKIIRLNPLRHNTNLVLKEDNALTPEECHEKNRLKQIGKLVCYSDENDPKVITEVRFRSGLNVSRSLGDEKHKAFGLLNIPDVFRHEFSLTAGQTVAVFSGCDGMEEVLDSEKFLEFFAEKLKMFPISDFNLFMLMFVVAVYLSGSKDNLSFQAAILEGVDKYFAVIDGHCGDGAAEFISRIFDTILKEKIRLLLHEQRENQPILAFFQKIDPHIPELLNKIHLLNREIEIFKHAAVIMQKLHCRSQTTDSKNDEKELAVPPQSAMVHEFKRLLQSCHAVLAIRVNYDPLMPNSFDERFADYHHSEIKEYIACVETGVSNALECFVQERFTAEYIIEQQILQLEGWLPDFDDELAKPYFATAYQLMLEVQPWHAQRRTLVILLEHFNLQLDLAEKIKAVLYQRLPNDKKADVYLDTLVYVLNQAIAIKAACPESYSAGFFTTDKKQEVIIWLQEQIRRCFPWMNDIAMQKNSDIIKPIPVRASTIIHKQ